MHPATAYVLQFFRFSHLPEHLQEVSKPFGELAAELAVILPGSAEATVCLRKLLEAKDCAVRARLAEVPNAEELLEALNAEVLSKYRAEEETKEFNEREALRAEGYLEKNGRLYHDCVHRVRLTDAYEDPDPDLRTRVELEAAAKRAPGADDAGLGELAEIMTAHASGARKLGNMKATAGAMVFNPAAPVIVEGAGGARELSAADKAKAAAWAKENHMPPKHCLGRVDTDVTEPGQ